MSNSIIVNWFLTLYRKLELYFENSFTFKVLCKIKELGKNSFIVRFITFILTKESDGNIKANSKIHNAIDRFFSFIHKIALGVFSKSDNSLVCNLIKKFISPLENLAVAANALCFLGVGFFVARFIFMTIRYGFVLKIALINGGMFLFLGIISFIDYETLENIIKNNIIAKLIRWFFVE